MPESIFSSLSEGEREQMKSFRLINQNFKLFTQFSLVFYLFKKIIIK